MSATKTKGKDIIKTSGKRKKAVARATLKEGSGQVRVNGIPLEHYGPRLSQLKVREPLILVEEVANKVDISVRVHSGGISSQAEAARLAIARALIQYDQSSEETLLNYDRRLLVADVRRKESSKPNRHGKARAKIQKSYR